VDELSWLLTHRFISVLGGVMTMQSAEGIYTGRSVFMDRKTCFGGDAGTARAFSSTMKHPSVKPYPSKQCPKVIQADTLNVMELC
jgi:hypothetical protein